MYKLMRSRENSTIHNVHHFLLFETFWTTFCTVSPHKTKKKDCKLYVLELAAAVKKKKKTGLGCRERWIT